MSEPTDVHAPHDEQTPEDAAFQRKDWKVQQIARVGFRGVVVAALLGLLGNGPLSRTTREGSWGSDEYDRFLRAKSRIVVSLKPSDEPTRLDLGDVFAAEDELKFAPHTLNEAISDHHRWLDIPAHDQVSTVIIHWRPHGAGVRRGALAVGGEPVEIWAVIYP